MYVFVISLASLGESPTLSSGPAVLETEKAHQGMSVLLLLIRCFIGFRNLLPSHLPDAGKGGGRVRSFLQLSDGHTHYFTQRVVPKVLLKQLCHFKCNSILTPPSRVAVQNR